MSNLTKDLNQVNESEVQDILETVNEIRLTFTSKSHSDLIFYLSSILQDASENEVHYEHSDMSKLFAHEQLFLKLLR